MYHNITKLTKRNRAGEATGFTYRARYVDDLGETHTQRFVLKKDAQAWLDEATAAVLDGSHVGPRDGLESLESYYTAYRAVQIWERSTVQAMDLAVLNAPFAERPLREISKRMIETWVKSMDTKGLAASTIKTRFNNVRSVLRAAVTERRIARDPTQGVQLPALRKASAAMQLPTPGEVRSLLENPGDYWVPLWALCAFAGLRLGEAAALKPEDIDFLGRRIVVARQVQRVGGGVVEIRLPKYRSERTVEVPDALLLLLASHLENQPHRQWVFGVDTPPHQNTVGHHWRRAKKRAGIKHRLRLHDLRHWFASGLIRSGCDVVTVQKALGHSKPTVTLNTYAHLWPDAGDRIRTASAELWRETWSDVDTAQATEGVS